MSKKFLSIALLLSVYSSINAIKEALIVTRTNIDRQESQWRVICSGTTAPDSPEKSKGKNRGRL